VERARAQFYPNVNLLGFAGFQSVGFTSWLDPGSRTWGVGPAVSLPVFDAGRLRANLSAQTADVDAAVASYNAVLIDAVRDVADQIGSIRSIERQAAEQRAAQTAAESAYELATLRYRAGLGNYLTVLAAETSVLERRRLGITLRARRLDATIQLMRALGGGYQADDIDPLARGGAEADAALTADSDARGPR
jgi:outer membrane protein TolC